MTPPRFGAGGFSAKLDSIAAPMRHSFTNDQGKKMASHAELKKDQAQDLHLRSAQSLAARQRRKHQRSVAPVFIQWH
jgi:hypothetical protein